MAGTNEMGSVERQLVGLPLAGPETFTIQQLAYLKRALGLDETLLWSGKEAAAGTVITLSELQTNFEYLVFGISGVYDREPVEYKVKVQPAYFSTLEVLSMDGNYVFRWLLNLLGDSTNLTKISIARSTGIRTSLAGASPTAFTPATTGTYSCGLLYIKGVHRIAGGN